MQGILGLVTVGGLVLNQAKKLHGFGNALLVLQQTIPAGCTINDDDDILEQEVKVIWQKAPHGGPIPRLGVTPGGRKLYHWIPGVGFPISVP